MNEELVGCTHDAVAATARMRVAADSSKWSQEWRPAATVATRIGGPVQSRTEQRRRQERVEAIEEVREKTILVKMDKRET